MVRTRPLAALVAGLATTLAIGVSTVPAHAADTVHTGPNWSWTGPSSWSAVYGTYGITVLGDKGAVVDLGFSSTPCSPGANWNQSVVNYFKSKRQALKASGLNLTSASAIKSLDSQYRRQVVTFTKRSGGKDYRGVAILDYDFTTNVDGFNYCFQQSESRSSVAKHWAAKAPQLAKVRKSFAYSGPGAPQTPQ